jgi:hypothetical protein
MNAQINHCIAVDTRGCGKWIIVRHSPARRQASAVHGVWRLLPVAWRRPAGARGINVCPPGFRFFTARARSPVTTHTLTLTEEAAMAAFPPITHVAVTVTDLDRSTRWYGELLAAEPVLDEDEQAGGFHHAVFALGGGSYSACIPTPRPQVTPSTSTAPALIMLPSPAATAMSCGHGLRAWTSLASGTAESRTPTTALVSPSATQTESPSSSSRRPPDPRPPSPRLTMWCAIGRSPGDRDHPGVPVRDSRRPRKIMSRCLVDHGLARP